MKTKPEKKPSEINKTVGKAKNQIEKSVEKASVNKKKLKVENLTFPAHFEKYRVKPNTQIYKTTNIFKAKMKDAAFYDIDDIIDKKKKIEEFEMEILTYESIIKDLKIKIRKLKSELK